MDAAAEWAVDMELAAVVGLEASVRPKTLFKKRWGGREGRRTEGREGGTERRRGREEGKERKEGTTGPKWSQGPHNNKSRLCCASSLSRKCDL